MLKELIRKIVLRLWPEMAAGLHLPIWAIVTAVPDPPTGGEVSDEFTPKYAVDIRLLKPDLSIDEDMPLMRDVPVAMTASAPDRGFAALPQPGTIVELAFAFGHQTRPYIRSVIPLTRKLPMIDALSMRWQQTADSFQEVDAKGNWHLETNLNMSCHVGMNRTQVIDLNWDRIIGLSYTEGIGMNYTRTIGVNYTETIGGTYTSTVMLARTETVNESWARQTVKSLTETVGQNYNITVGGAYSEAVIGIWTRSAATIQETGTKLYQLNAPMIYEGNSIHNLWEIVYELMNVCSGQFNSNASAQVESLKSLFDLMIVKKENVWTNNP